MPLAGNIPAVGLAGVEALTGGAYPWLSSSAAGAQERGSNLPAVKGTSSFDKRFGLAAWGMVGSVGQIRQLNVRRVAPLGAATAAVQHHKVKEKL